MRTAKTLIRLGRCPGWSASSLGTQPHYWFCHEVAHLSPRLLDSLGVACNCGTPWTFHLSHLMTRTKWLCGQRRLRSAWASAQTNQSSLSTWRVHSEDWSDWVPRLIWVFAGRTVIFLAFNFFGTYKASSSTQPNSIIFTTHHSTPTNHSHAKPRSIQNFHKGSFWLSIRRVKNAHLL